MLAIRPALPADYAAWLPLWEGYNTFYHRDIDPEALPFTWARFFDPYEPVHAFVAEQENTLVGFVHFLYHRNVRTIKPSCYLQDLFTTKAARGRGIGRSLIEAVYARAKIDGAERVYWITQEANLTAQALYSRLAERTTYVTYQKLL